MKMFTNRRTLVAIIALVLVSATVTGIAYAVLTIGTGSSSFPIANGSELAITGATITNGSSTSTCSLSGEQFTCSLQQVDQGANATVKVTVHNSGQVAGQVWTTSTCQAKNSSGTFNCSSDGSLYDAQKTTVKAGSSVTLQIVFEVYATADTNDTISLSTSVIQS